MRDCRAREEEVRAGMEKTEQSEKISREMKSVKRTINVFCRVYITLQHELA